MDKILVKRQLKEIALVTTALDVSCALVFGIGFTLVTHGSDFTGNAAVGVLIGFMLSIPYILIRAANAFD